MDVCESNGDFHILELNSLSCSGLYDCDLAEVVKVLSATAESEWKEKHCT